MKIKALKYVLLLPLMYVTINLTAQEIQSDSLLKVEQKNTAYLSDLKSQKTNTRAKAKEAQRAGRNANDAANESSKAYRSERRAQKSRKDADKHATRAKRSRTKSDN